MELKHINGTFIQGVYEWRIEKNLSRGRSLATPWLEQSLPGRVLFVSLSLLDEKGFDQGPIAGSRVLFGDSRAFSEGEYMPLLPSVSLSAVWDASGQEKGLFRFKLGLVAGEELYAGDLLKVQVTFCMEMSSQEGAERPRIESPKASWLNLTPGTEQGAADGDEATGEPARIDRFFIENPPKFLHGGWKYTLRCAAEPQRSLPMEEIEWSVQEGGGTIDTYGCYTAPEHPGMFEVFARHIPSGLSASAYMIVRE